MSSVPQLSKDHVFDPGDVDALPYMTNIDRRHSTRTVPLRVLGLGFSRTGTVSLRQALVKLGYTDCYHFASPIQENPPDAQLWIEALEANFKGIGKPYGKAEFDAVLGHCQAVTDTPCIMFYKELLAAYPDAKVVLTQRDNTDQWFQSQMATVMPYCAKIVPTTWFGRLMARFSPFDPNAVRMTELVLRETPVYSALWKDYHEGTSTAKKVYEDYNAEIKRIVPRENLLVFNVKEGWDPLCRFLGEKTPNEDFPRRNGQEVFAQNIAKFSAVTQAVTQKNMLMVGTGVAAVIGAFAVAVGRW